jgi:LacI family transcriptional regulator
MSPLAREIEHRVLILASPVFGVCRAAVRGAIRFAQIQGTWEYTFVDERRCDEAFLEMYSYVDGILFSGTSGKRLRQIVDADKPVVVMAMGSAVDAPDVPGIRIDHEAMVRAGYEHLRSLGYKRFATLSVEHHGLSVMRSDMLCQIAAADGLMCCGNHLSSLPLSRKNLPHTEKQLGQWISSLPKPIGILTYDIRSALAVLNGARRAEVAIPEQVAILAGEEDDLLAESGNPPLSTVSEAGVRIGLEAAEMLQRIFEGEAFPEQRSHPPGGIITRGTTGRVIENEKTAEAVHLLRREARVGRTEEQILQRVGGSRARLETEFRKWLGHSLEQELRQVRLAFAKELLMYSSLECDDIAARSGFESLVNLNRVFQEEFGINAMQYRTRNKVYWQEFAG